MIKNFSAALSFLTVFRLPLGESILSPKELAASFACFPLAGLVLGSIYSATAVLLAGHMPDLILAAIITSLTALLTRGLHFDGLADLADGIWGGSTRERRLEIMKDSRSGAFGVLAIVLAVALKIASVHALILAGSYAPLFVAPILSRFAMAAAAYGSDYARPQGLGKPFLENMRFEHLVTAATVAALCSIPAGIFSLLGFASVLCCVIFMKTVSKKYLGGITGDVLGAVNETGEIVVLVLGACVSGA